MVKVIDFILTHIIAKYYPVIKMKTENILTRKVLIEKAPFWIEVRYFSHIRKFKVVEATTAEIEYMKSLPGDVDDEFVLVKGGFYKEVECTSCHLIPKNISIKI